MPEREHGKTGTQEHSNTRTLKRRKLVLVGPAYPYRGGIAHFAELLYYGLRGRGHHVEAVTFTRQYPERLFPGKTQYEAEPPAEPVPAVRLIDSLNPLSWLRAVRHVARRRPEAVLFQYWMPFFAPAFGGMAWYLRAKGIRPLAVVHNALPHERRPGDVLLSKFFLNACEGFVALSGSVEEDLRRLMGDGKPTVRVEHPVYDRFGPPPSKAEARRMLDLPEGVPVLLFFGFVRRYKGLHTLLEAMPRVLEAQPEARLAIAGEFYDDAAPYRALIRRHGLEERVQVCDRYLPDGEVPRYFAAADVVVQPYVRATQSGVAQVAFHFARPLVTTDVGGLAEVAEGVGLVVPPEDPAALAEALTHFFADEELRARLADGARKRGQSAPDASERLCEAVEDLIGGL